jgi:predicted permease
MKGMWQDFRYGFRSLRRQRGFTALSLLVLGTAIAVNTSLFTAFNAVLLRPWAVPDPDAVVKIFAIGSKGPRAGGLSLAEHRYLGEHAKSVSGLVAMRDGGSDHGLVYQHVTGNFFDVLRVPMERGRGFRADEDRIDNPAAVAVLSYAAWQRHFGGDPGAIGRPVHISDIPFTVVGITSREFTGTQANRRDVWLPFSTITLLRPHDNTVRAMLTDPSHCCVSIAGRLAAGASVEAARTELTHLSHQFQSQSGLEGRRDILLASTTPIADPKMPREILPVAALMFLALTLVLLVACANVGNLVLARGMARRREIAVRLSLGASRARVVWQLMTESLLLAGLAGGIGMAAAWLLPPYLLATLSNNIGLSVRPDLGVLAFTVCTVTLACLAFGLAPALHCTRRMGAFNERAESSTLRFNLRGTLLAVQVAASVVLLVGAGLLVRGVQHAYSLDPGFAVHEVSVVSFSVDEKAYDGARTRLFLHGLQDELSRLPGSPAHGFTQLAPLGNSRMGMTVPSPRGETRVLLQSVTAGYFDVLRIPILRGRSFISADEGRPVALVNETLARLMWPDGSALGRTLTMNEKPHEVLGVVRDARTTHLDRVEPTLYRPVNMGTPDGVHGLPSVLIRHDTGVSQETMAALVARLDPRAEARLRRLSDNLDEGLQPVRVGAALAGVLGTLALVLATIGLAGVFAYVVQQRTREIGIRMALGARAGDVVRVVLGSSSRATILGLAVGFVGAVAASLLMRSQLYGMSPFDPAVYASVASLLMVAGLTASYVPARRAMCVDPVVALRYE